MTFIRGAISVESDTKEQIYKQSIKLFDDIKKCNNLDSLVAVFASQTNDLKAYNCCTAIREFFDLQCALECFQEANINNAPKKIIRFTLICNDTFNPINVYLDNAQEIKSVYSKI